MSDRRLAIAREAVLWIFTLFLAYVFLQQGIAKFSDSSGWARAFRTWHYPDWFRVLIGVIEISAVLILFVRRFALVGAVMIMVVMLGGMATHIYWGQPRYVTSEILPLVLATIIAFGRKRLFLAGNRELKP
ncbi:MAG: DoxX family protein [Vicinamibacterales bacterium]